MIIFRICVLFLVFKLVKCTEAFYCFPHSENDTKFDTLYKKDDFFAERDVDFILYTGSEERSFIQANFQSIESSSFNASLPTRIVIHGFCDGPNDKDFIAMRNAFRERGDFNVIMVDWTKGSVTFIYTWAKDRTVEVGIIVAQFINFLYHNKFIKNYLDVTIIGHSLGAHVAGIAGKYTKEKVKIIYGLDPAGPLYYSHQNPEEMLNENDAVMTIGLRTNSKKLGCGYEYPLAKIEFYPNYGKCQPNCGICLFSNKCSHLAAIHIFTKSLSANFTAHKCNTFDEIDNKDCSNSGIGNFVGEGFDMNTSEGYYYFSTPII